VAGIQQGSETSHHPLSAVYSYRHFGSSPYSSFQLNVLIPDVFIEAFNASWEFLGFWMATSKSGADLQLPQFSRRLKMIMFMKSRQNGSATNCAQYTCHAMARPTCLLTNQ
jgi:hypothetical protein